MTYYTELCKSLGVDVYVYYVAESAEKSHTHTHTLERVVYLSVFSTLQVMGVL